MGIEHTLPPDLLRHRTMRILVIGAGGTGSAIVLGLPYLDQAMRAWGHRSGLEVMLMDGDVVSETNSVRQAFSVSDIGHSKATVLVNRINLFWGTRWVAIPNHFHARSFDRNQDSCPDLVIGCVDTRAGRKAIVDSFSGALNHVCYWLDLGNNAAAGQYVLGQPLNARNRRKAERLRTVSELYPEVIDVGVGEDPLPSCSAVEALDRQEPFINQTLASSALAMLAQLFRYGRLSHHGAFFNAKTGQMRALPVDPELWSKTRRRSRKSIVRSSTGRTAVTDRVYGGRRGRLRA
jgi:PRTRC genetic system ThiF family protein